MVGDYGKVTSVTRIDDREPSPARCSARRATSIGSSPIPAEGARSCRCVSPSASTSTPAVVGAGKVALLEAIRKTGSISAAGRAHQMSYRRAWLLVEELNKSFREPLVSPTGGANGGGAKLTPAGEHVIALYRAAEQKMREAADAEIVKLEEALASA